MSFGERLFARLLAAIRAVADPQARVRAARAAAPAQSRRHLALLATAMAGRKITVAVAAGEGGLGRDLLVFPLQLDALGTSQENAVLTTLRAVVGGLMLREATVHRPPEDPGARAMATLVVLARALRDLQQELAGAAAALPPVLSALRETRRELRGLRGSELALEAAAHAVLGAPLDELAAAAPGLDREWLAAVAAGDPEVSSEPARGARCPAIPLCGWLGVALPDDALAELPPAAGVGSQQRGGRERAGRAAEQLKRRELQEDESAENPLTHSFEKVHTLEKYQGGRKRVDGADELEAHGDALDELELDEVVRSRTATSSVYRADLPGFSGTSGEAQELAPPQGALSYDEWDEGARRYRRAWCQVRVEHQPPVASVEATRRFTAQALARYRRERAELAEQFARLATQPRRVGRQPDGPDIDVDAIVERHGALRHGTTGPEKLYVAQRRKPPELAVALLLDRSLSSDSWVANQRVLDVGADALVALGSALPPEAARTAVLAFASHTRRDCRLAVLKPFDASWNTMHGRLAALSPEGYTRIGPALRHATSVLDGEPARRKLLVLLSDGKPTDYDQYEGRYGLADVQKAVEEAGRAGIAVFAVALDQRARSHLPRMFGPGGFAVVTRPRELVTAVGHLVQQRLAR